MNLDETTRREAVRELHGLWFSKRAIAKACGVSVEMVHDDVAALKLARTHRPRPHEVFAAVLRHYIELVHTHYSVPPLKYSIVRQFLGEWLGIDKVTAFLTGCQQTMDALTIPGYGPDGLPFFRLLCAVFDSRRRYLPHDNLEGFLHGYWGQLRSGERAMPRSNDELLTGLAKAYAESRRGYNAPMWGPEALKHIRATIDTLRPRVVDVLVRRFGLDGSKPENQTIVAQHLGVSPSVVGRLEHEGLVALRRTGRAYRLKPYLETTHEAAVRVAQEGARLRVIDEILVSRRGGGTSVASPVELRLLVMPIADLSLSVRSWNALQNVDVELVGELVQKTDQELLKSRNFGRKSLKEIKEVLTELGLSLGMQFDDTTRALLMSLRAISA